MTQVRRSSRPARSISAARCTIEQDYFGTRKAPDVIELVETRSQVLAASGFEFQRLALADGGVYLFNDDGSPKLTQQTVDGLETSVQAFVGSAEAVPLVSAVTTRAVYTVVADGAADSSSHFVRAPLVEGGYYLYNADGTPIFKSAAVTVGGTNRVNSLYQEQDYVGTPASAGYTVWDQGRLEGVVQPIFASEAKPIQEETFVYRRYVLEDGGVYLFDDEGRPLFQSVAANPIQRYSGTQTLVGGEPVLENVESRRLVTEDSLAIDVGDTNGDGVSETVTTFYRYRLDSGSYLHDVGGAPSLALQKIGGRDYWVQKISGDAVPDLDRNGNLVLARSETRARSIAVIAAVEQVFARGLTGVAVQAPPPAGQETWQSFVRWQLKAGGEYLYNADGSPKLVQQFIDGSNVDVQAYKGERTLVNGQPVRLNVETRVAAISGADAGGITYATVVQDADSVSAADRKQTDFYRYVLEDGGRYLYDANGTPTLSSIVIGGVTYHVQGFDDAIVTTDGGTRILQAVETRWHNTSHVVKTPVPETDAATGKPIELSVARVQKSVDGNPGKVTFIGPVEAGSRWTVTIADTAKTYTAGASDGLDVDVVAAKLQEQFSLSGYTVAVVADGNTADEHASISVTGMTPPPSSSPRRRAPASRCIRSTQTTTPSTTCSSIRATGSTRGPMSSP